MPAPDRARGSVPMHRRTFPRRPPASPPRPLGGIEGILAARRAPAFAQGTKLHWVRWVDFIPESDVELKRQMPEASKAARAEVALETINANDLQPRITAAIQSGSGADIFMLQYNWPHLYQNALVDVSDVAERVGQGEGGFYDVYPPACKVNGKWLACPTPSSATRSPTGSRGSRRPAPRSTQDAGTTSASSSPRSRRRASPTGRRSATPSATRPRSPIRCSWAFGGAETDKSGKKVVLNSQGRGRGGQVHAGVLEGVLRRGRAGLGRHQQQPRLPRRRDLAPPSTAPRSTSWPSGRRTRSRTTRASRCGRTSTTRRSPPGPAGPFLLFLNHSHAVMKYGKNQKLAKDLLRWLHSKENYEKWFQIQEGYSVGATKSWENNPMWDKIDEPLKMFRTAAARHARMLRPRRPVDRQGHRGLHQVHHHRHVRQGRPGHDGGGRREVGGGRAEEDLRGVVVGEEPA